MVLYIKHYQPAPCSESLLTHHLFVKHLVPIYFLFLISYRLYLPLLNFITISVIILRRKFHHAVPSSASQLPHYLFVNHLLSMYLQSLITYRLHSLSTLILISVILLSHEFHHAVPHSDSLLSHYLFVKCPLSAYFLFPY